MHNKHNKAKEYEIKPYGQATQRLLRGIKAFKKPHAKDKV